MKKIFLLGMTLSIFSSCASTQYSTQRNCSERALAHLNTNPETNLKPDPVLYEAAKQAMSSVYD